MQTIRDDQGREWRLAITYGDVLNIRMRCGVDLLTEHIETLAVLDDPVVLIEVLMCLCADQMAWHKVSAEDFADSMLPDEILDATADRLMEALAEFFPEPEENSKSGKAVKPVSIDQSIHEAAALARVEPFRYSLRQLFWMCRTAELTEWDRAALVASLIHNVNCTSTGKQVSAIDINPYREKPTSSFAEIKKRRAEARNGV